MVTKWAVFYDTGEILTSAQCGWRELPITGATIAVWWDERNIRHLECGADSLVYTDDAIVSVNLPTEILVAAAEKEAYQGTLKYGVYMDSQAWVELRERADNLREFPE